MEHDQVLFHFFTKDFLLVAQKLIHYIDCVMHAKRTHFQCLTYFAKPVDDELANLVVLAADFDYLILPLTLHLAF